MNTENLQVGQAIVMLVETTGDDEHSVQWTFPVGAFGRVLRIDDYPFPQGRAVTVGIEDTIVNTFDESDGEGPFFVQTTAQPKPRATADKWFVTWEVDVGEEAATELEAALHAHALTRLGPDGANAYKVYDRAGNCTEIDIGAHEHEENKLMRWRCAVADGSTTLGYEQWSEGLDD